MNPSPTSSAAELHPKSSAAPRGDRLFHTGAAALLIVLMLWGFEQFYFHGRAYPDRPLTPPIRTLIITHGSAMAVWMLLFLLQPLLIVIRQRKAHMLFGRFATVVALAVVYFGFRLGIESTRVSPPDLHIWGLPAKQFMIVPIASITLFAGFLAAALATVRRPAVHRSLMLLATMSAMSAAISRITVLSNLYIGTVWQAWFGPFFTTLLVALLLLGVKSAMARSLDRTYAWGCAGLVLASAAIVKLAPSAAWDRVASFLLS